jgi:hypothetical protein
MGRVMSPEAIADRLKLDNQQRETFKFWIANYRQAVWIEASQQAAHQTVNAMEEMLTGKMSQRPS